jgi:hypothetical protein
LFQLDLFGIVVVAARFQWGENKVRELGYRIAMRDRTDPEHKETPVSIEDSQDLICEGVRELQSRTRVPLTVKQTVNAATDKGRAGYKCVYLGIVGEHVLYKFNSDQSPKLII